MFVLCMYIIYWRFFCQCCFVKKKSSGIKQSSLILAWTAGVGVAVVFTWIINIVIVRCTGIGWIAVITAWTATGFARKMRIIAIPATTRSCFCSQVTGWTVWALTGNRIGICNWVSIYASTLPSIVFWAASPSWASSWAAASRATALRITRFYCSVSTAVTMTGWVNGTPVWRVAITTWNGIIAFFVAASVCCAVGTTCRIRRIRIRRRTVHVAGVITGIFAAISTVSSVGRRG